MDQAFRDFILAHADDDCDRLLLSKEKWPDMDVRAAVNCIISRRKLKGKLPSWWAEEELFYPQHPFRGAVFRRGGGRTQSRNSSWKRAQDSKDSGPYRGSRS